MKISILILAFCSAAFAQEAQPEMASSVKQIRIDLLVVRLPTAKAIGLQKELRDPKTIERGIQKLMALIEKDQAELVDWPSLTTKSGNRAVAENVREIRYPIEFDIPHVIPAKPSSPEGTMVPKPTAPTPGEAPAGETPPPRPAKPGAPITTAGPTTFETKNIGVTLEVEPQIGPDGNFIDMNLAPQHVSLIGYRREIFEAKGIFEIAVEQPIFDTQKTATNITLKNGESQLLGFYNVLEPKKTVELHIVTATILEAKIPAPAATPRKAGQ